MNLSFVNIDNGITISGTQMITKDQIIAFIDEWWATITLERLALMTLLSVSLVAVFTAFEFRTTIFARFFKETAAPTEVSWVISDESKAQLVRLTTHNPIGAVTVVDVDLHKNRRTIKYMYGTDASTVQYATDTQMLGRSSALFDFDQKNTIQMVAMLNNEFKCYLTSDTTSAKVMPGREKIYPHLCRLAVPPYFGEFAGYITILLTRKPTNLELDSIKIEVNRVAIEMYLRDIASKKK